MNKKDIIKQAAEELGISQSESSALFDAVFDELTDLLTQGKSLTIYGFGTFFCKYLEERQGYDLSTKQTVLLPAKNKVHFHPSDSLKEIINGDINDTGN